MVSRIEKLEAMFEKFHALKRAMGGKFSRDICDVPITNSQWMVLDYIARHDAVSIKDIGSALGITSSAATQFVNELEKNDYAEKHASTNDKRAIVVSLSAKAKTTFKEMRTKVVGRLTNLFSVLNDEEFANYIVLTEKVFEHINP